MSRCGAGVVGIDWVTSGWRLGADTSLKNEEGLTPYQLAKDPETATLLMDRRQSGRVTRVSLQFGLIPPCF